MPSPVRIAPSMLCANPLRFEEQARCVLDAGAQLLHMDVMDGRFVPNLSFGPFVVEALAPLAHEAGALVDVHLMIEEPERFVQAFLDAGADILTVHLEASRDLAGTLKGIRARGCRAGITLRPKTPLLSLHAFLPLVDQVLVMSVEPGYGGQTFLPGSVARVKRVREMLDEIGSAANLEVDGGIGTDNAGELAEAGADMLVVGNAVFKAEDPGAAVRAILAAAQGRAA